MGRFCQRPSRIGECFSSPGSPSSLTSQSPDGVLLNCRWTVGRNPSLTNASTLGTFFYDAERGKKVPQSRWTQLLRTWFEYENSVESQPKNTSFSGWNRSRKSGSSPWPRASLNSPLVRVFRDCARRKRFMSQGNAANQWCRPKKLLGSFERSPVSSVIFLSLGIP
jgi:hypothetical protein